MQGTLSGSAKIYIESSVPGVFRSSGTIDVQLLPFTADTYFITGGEITNDFIAFNGHFTISGGAFNKEFDLYSGVCTITGGIFHDELYVYDGTCTISGGTLLYCYMTISNHHGNPTVLLSGSAEIFGVWLDIDTDKDSSDMCLTVSGNARVTAMDFEIDGEGNGKKPNLLLNGGYFVQNPITWKNDSDMIFTYRFSDVPEEYAGQQNWSADGAKYPWRINQAGFEAQFVLPPSLSRIEANAFEGNPGIKAAYVPNTCASIGAEAFKGCTGLKKIRLPKDCSIDDSAFDGCTSLIAIYAPADGTTEAWAIKNSIPFVNE